MIDRKADDLVRGGGVRLEFESDKRVHFTVGDHLVIFSKVGVFWSCDCKFFSLKGRACSHIIAAKRFWESVFKNRAEKELLRVRFARKELRLLVDDERSRGLLCLVDSYLRDAEFFFGRGDFLECFELCVYVFGLLDSAARLGVIDPGEARDHYKV